MFAAAKLTVASTLAFVGSLFGYVQYRRYNDSEQIRRRALRDIGREKVRKMRQTYIIPAPELQKQLEPPEGETCVQIQDV